MKKVESIWAELSAKAQESTELSEEVKVELGISDDLKYAKGVEMFGKNIDISLDQLDKAFRALRVDSESLKEDMRVMQRGIATVDKAAKDLGVNPNEVDGYKEAISALQYGESQLSKAKKFL